MTANPITDDSPYDPLDPAHVGYPGPRLAEARSRCPVSQPRPGVFVVARHDDVAGALQDPASYSSENNFVLEGGTETATAVLAGDPRRRSALLQWCAGGQPVAAVSVNHRVPVAKLKKLSAHAVAAA